MTMTLFRGAHAPRVLVSAPSPKSAREDLRLQKCVIPARNASHSDAGGRNPQSAIGNAP